MPLSFKKTQNQETDSKIEEQKNLQQQNEEDAVEEHENLLKTQENNDHSEQLLCETYESFLNDIVQGKTITRTLHKTAFMKEKGNGEIVNRDWLIYSRENKPAYCYVCKLFSNKNTQFSQKQDFDNWKNIHDRLKDHEDSTDHRTCIRRFIARSNLKGRIDVEINNQWNTKKRDTRWSARAGAIRAIINGFNEIKSALQKLEEDVSQKRLIQIEARGLYDKMKSFEFCLMTVLWNKVLNRINATSKSLQEITDNLNIVCTLYESLIGFVQELRNDFDSIEEQAKEICGNFTDAIYSTDF
ncbi:hypothetical protein ILUMI_12346 [Ignelater luminosus]|uniref:TTF-type domain-containing protein n=1 Tax=Ignelater luminosus TaxID=2038154 RepID=A0A8K0D0H8_IGNLU|nr:hypothetical protein ILUMI_12346 [Ignelater luminosus]